MTLSVMKKSVFGLFLLMIFNMYVVFGAIPAQERAALIALYNSTHGDQWNLYAAWKTPPLHSDGFSMPGTEGNWVGITVTSDHVTKIALPEHKLKGSLPSQLGNLTYLEELDFANRFVGDMDAWNELSGGIPTELGNLTNLKKLYLDSNQFNGSIPSSLGNLIHLQELNLSWNHNLIGSIPASFGNLAQLQKLNIEGTQISGSIPPQLGNLSNLQILSLYWNKLTAFPAELGNLSSLKELNLDGNQLSGSIPSTFGNLGNLEKLILTNNKLTGSIPSQLGNLTHLKDFKLCSNQLSGSIPSELGNLANLEYLDLGYNNLKGSIPAELGNLTKLDHLILNHNQLTGSIPSELGNLNNIVYINIDRNELSGLIPVGIKNLSKLASFEIDYNCLRAEDPDLREWLKRHAGADWEDTQVVCGQPISLPTVVTNPVISINATSVECSGTVTDSGGLPIIGRGICWSEGSSNPTVKNSHISLGTGTGSFSTTLNDLKTGTTYHVRAFAFNDRGVAYGSDVSFTMKAGSSITLDRSLLIFTASTSGKATESQTVMISNSGQLKLKWSATSDRKWLVFTPTQGTSGSILSVAVDPFGLEPGYYSGSILISDPEAINSPQAITVKLQVIDEGKSTVPFGEFSTPLEGTTLSNSISLTGWALDDIGIVSVKIYNSTAYIGDAVFIKGARPDVEEAYPSYPNSDRAGWGYMLLSRFLPDQGNGTYTLIAKATDMEGNEVVLGSKTITIDNAHSVKPFGAIDTPAQGETISGSNFVNFGWALTPPNAFIPTDGSSIDVVIDGVTQGHPVYNQFRTDIAALFPGYNNSGGAGGYYYIDTTTLKNGLHTISWDVSDSMGNKDGIGSRYFTVINSQSDRGSSSEIDAVPVTNGEGLAAQIESIAQSECETIRIHELERVEIDLTENICINSVGKVSSKGLKSLNSEIELLNPELSVTSGGAMRYEGYLIVNHQFKECPIGSTLDKNRGVFYWQPGPGFIGQYRFFFTGKDEHGTVINKNVMVDIKPGIK